MAGERRWSGNWRVVGPPGAVRFELPRSPRRRRIVERRLRELPAGTAVVLCAPAPGGARRCRRVAARAGLDVERRYLALPSAAAPAFLVEEARAPVEHFARNVLAAPSAPVAACLSAVRALGPWPALRTLAPGRVVVGRRR